MSSNPFDKIIADARLREEREAEEKRQADIAKEAERAMAEAKEAERRKQQAPIMFGKAFLQRACDWALAQRTPDGKEWSAEYLTFIDRLCDELLRKQDPDHPTKITHHDKVLDLFEKTLTRFPDVPGELFYGQRLLTQRRLDRQAATKTRTEQLVIKKGKRPRVVVPIDEAREQRAAESSGAPVTLPTKRGRGVHRVPKGSAKTG